MNWEIKNYTLFYKNILVVAISSFFLLAFFVFAQAPPSSSSTVDKTITFKITDGLGDVDQRYSDESDYGYNDDSVNIGYRNFDGVEPVTGKYISGFHFSNVTLPKGFLIKSAQLKYRWGRTRNYTSYGGPISTRIYAENTDNSAPFTTDYQNGPLFRSKTSASVAWTVNGYTDGQYGTSPDIAPIIQEIINRPGWTSGNAITILHDDTNANERLRVRSYELNPADSTELVITYTEEVSAPILPPPPPPAPRAANPCPKGLPVFRETVPTMPSPDLPVSLSTIQVPSVSPCIPSEPPAPPPIPVSPPVSLEAPLETQQPAALPGNIKNEQKLSNLSIRSSSECFPGECWDNLIDGDIIDWDGTVTAKKQANAFAVIDLPGDDAYALTKITLLTDTGVEQKSRWVKNFHIETSLDGTLFIPTLSGVKTMGGAETYFFSNLPKAKFVKILFDSNNGASDWYQAGELEIWATQAICGDGMREPGEQCDASDLPANACVLFGFTTGTPSCSSTCMIQTDQCSSPVIKAVQNGNWSDPNTWGGAVPTADQAVVISDGFTVMYDMSWDTNPAAEAGKITLSNGGMLKFSRTKSTRFDLNGSLVVRDGGILDVGTVADPIPPAINVWIGFNVSDDRLFSSNDPKDPNFKLPPEPSLMDFHPEDIGLWTLGAASRTFFHGTTQPRTWLHLVANAAAGASSVELEAAPIGWRIGDKVIIAPTGTNPYEAEVRSIASISGTRLTLTAPLSFTHTGRRYAINTSTNVIRSLGASENPSTSERLISVQGEAGILTHNVTVASNLVREGDPNHRAHTMYLLGSSGAMAYTEFRDLGPRAKLGRYPIHFHKLGSASAGFQLTGISVWSSISDPINKWIAVHGSSHAELRDVVGYNCQGRCFYLEDATEIGNIIERSLGVRSHFPEELPAGQGLDAAVFWLREANTYHDNVAAGADELATGFWITPTKSTVWPLPATEFMKNEIHTNGTGLVYANSSTTPLSAIQFTDGQFFRNNLGVWAKEIGAEAKVIHSIFLGNKNQPTDDAMYAEGQAGQFSDNLYFDDTDPPTISTISSGSYYTPPSGGYTQPSNGSYIYKIFTNGTMCDNTVFGDPAFGVDKQCYYRDITDPPNDNWIFCANEGEKCNFSGTKEVRYGPPEGYTPPAQGYTPPSGGYTAPSGECSGTSAGGYAYHPPLGPVIASKEFAHSSSNGFDPVPWDIIVYDFEHCAPGTFVFDWGIGNAGNQSGGPISFRATVNGQVVGNWTREFFESPTSGYPPGGPILNPGGWEGQYAYGRGPSRYGMQIRPSLKEDNTEICIEVNYENQFPETNAGNNKECITVSHFPASDYVASGNYNTGSGSGNYTPPASGGYTAPSGDCAGTYAGGYSYHPPLGPVIASKDFSHSGSGGFDPAAWYITVYDFSNCAPGMFVFDYGFGNAGSQSGGPIGFRATVNGSEFQTLPRSFFLDPCCGYPQSGAAIMDPGGPSGPYDRGPGAYGLQRDPLPKQPTEICIEIIDDAGDSNTGNNRGCLTVDSFPPDVAYSASNSGTTYDTGGGSTTYDSGAAADCGTSGYDPKFGYIPAPAPFDGEAKNSWNNVSGGPNLTPVRFGWRTNPCDPSTAVFTFWLINSGDRDFDSWNVQIRWNGSDWCGWHNTGYILHPGSQQARGPDQNLYGGYGQIQCDPLPREEGTLTMIVDPDNAMNEVNEGDNVFTAHVGPWGTYTGSSGTTYNNTGGGGTTYTPPASGGGGYTSSSGCSGTYAGGYSYHPPLGPVITSKEFSHSGSGGFDPAAWYITVYDFDNCAPGTFVVDWGFGNVGSECGGPVSIRATANGSQYNFVSRGFFIDPVSGYPQSGSAILCPGGPGGPYDRGPGAYGLQAPPLPKQQTEFCIQVNTVESVSEKNTGNNEGCLTITF